MISILLALLIGVLVVLVLFYIIDAAGLPSPANWIAKVIIALIAILFILQRSGFTLGV